jgi:hypothetical protein
MKKQLRSERNGLRVALVLAALGCGRASSPRTSSLSNWLNCEQDAECAAVASGAYCGEQGYCVDPSGTPLAVGGSEAAASSQTRLPSEGQALAELSLSSANQMLVDETGVIWVSACEGLFAVKGREVRRYTWFDSPLPQGPLQLSVDESNRIWVFSPGESLVVIDDGVFRTVYDRGSAQFSVSRDGTAWVTGSEPFEEFSHVWARHVYPTLGPEIDVPDPGVNVIAAGAGGSLWAATSTGIFHWSGSAWAGPFAPAVSLFNYDARQDVAYSDYERLRWNGMSVEREPLLADGSPPPGQQVGSDARGRLVTVSSSAVLWIEDGQVTERQSLSLTQTPLGAIGPDGALYLASDSSISKRGAASTRLATIHPFNPQLEFPWRAQPFGRTLATPTVDATREDLMNPSPQLIGQKLHVQGVAFGGFETAGVIVGGRVIPSTWAEPASELSSFLSERGRSPFVEISNGLEVGGVSLDDVTPWDLYGYLEAGSCFPQGERRQFWMVEGYPTDMASSERSSLASDLRARYPEP